jgi:hypothetical protein
MNVDEIEMQLRKRLDALGPALSCRTPPRPSPLDLKRAERIREFWSLPTEPHLRRAADQLDEDKAARAVVFGLLAE